MVQYIRGDLFETSADVIAHGVNCLGAFGAGIAGEIRRRWPEVYRAYLTKHAAEGWALGDVQVVTLEKRGDVKYIANCATQKGYGYSATQQQRKVFVDYNALERCLKTIIRYCETNKLTLAMPKIGAGLAGGDWNIISKLIEKCGKDITTDILVYIL